MTSANFYLLAIGAAVLCINVFFGEAIAARIASFFHRMSVAKEREALEGSDAKVEKGAPVI